MRVFETANSAWISTISELFREGAICSPRGLIIKEIQNFSLCIKNPAFKIISTPFRRMSLPYAFGELLWYLSGRNDLETMSYYSSRMKQFSDNGKTLNSAYGYRIFGHHPMIGFNQWENVKRILLEDPDSRQAIIHLHTPNDKKTKDEVCTLTLQFMVRDGKLDMITNMRSNDIVWGFTYDVFSFMSLQEMMATELGTQVGSYYHNAASMHLYEKDFEMASMVYSLREQLLSFEEYEKPFSFFRTGIYPGSKALAQLMEIENARRVRGDLWDPPYMLPDVGNIISCMLREYALYKMNSMTWDGLPYDNIYAMMFLNCYSGIPLRSSRMVILEGPDGVGKSYTAKHMQETENMSIILHFDRPTEDFDPMIYLLVAGMAGNIILDRSFISEFVYAQFYGRVPRIFSDKIDALFKVMSMRNITIVKFILPKDDAIEAILARLDEQDAEHLNEDRFKDLTARYMDFTLMFRNHLRHNVLFNVSPPGGL